MAYYNPNHGGQPQVQFPAPIVYYAVPAITYQSAWTKNYGQHYARQTSIGLGATQIVVACISIAAGVMAILYSAKFFYVGIGIWTGVWYLIAGSLAIAAGKDPTNNLIIATLVFSVFNILFGIAEVTTASIGVHDCQYYGYPGYYDECDDMEADAANSMMIAAGSLEIIFGFWMMVMSARAIDEGSKAQRASIPVTYAPHQAQAVFMQEPPVLQPQPPPSYNQPQPVLTQAPPALQPEPESYYEPLHFPSTSNQQQTMNAEVHQAPLTNIKF